MAKLDEMRKICEIFATFRAVYGEIFTKPFPKLAMAGIYVFKRARVFSERAERAERAEYRVIFRDKIGHKWALGALGALRTLNDEKNLNGTVGTVGSGRVLKNLCNASKYFQKLQKRAFFNEIWTTEKLLFLYRITMS